VSTFGVTSKLRSGKHIIIWDFDESSLKQVKENLRLTSLSALPEHLPKIYILETSPKCYSAICFARRKFSRSFWIAYNTDGVDIEFLSRAIDNGYFTLRVGPKDGYLPRLADVIESECEDEVSISDLVNWVVYHPGEYYEGTDIPITFEDNPELVWAFQRQLEAILQDNWNRR